MAETRDERRRKARADEEKRRAEIDEKLAEPKLPAFDAPATGKIVETPRTVKREITKKPS